MKSLDHKVALVTGVTRHQDIGNAVALALAQAGSDVATAYYRPYDRTMPWGVDDTEPEEILDGLRKAGARAHGFEIDLSKPDAPRILFQLAQERFGRIDILVNNAAYSAETTVEEMHADDLDRHYAVNLRAVMLLSAEFVRSLPVRSAGPDYQPYFRAGRRTAAQRAGLCGHKGRGRCLHSEFKRGRREPRDHRERRRSRPNRYRVDECHASRVADRVYSRGTFGNAERRPSTHRVFGV